MESKYLIDRDTLNLLREMYREERAVYPDCQFGFGWGGDSTGRRGITYVIYHDTKGQLPPIFYYDDVPLLFLFPYNIPEELQSGVVCFRDNQYKILPAEDFDPIDLVKGTLKEF